MKKIIASMLALLTVFSFVACQNNAQNDSTKDSSSNSNDIVVSESEALVYKGKTDYKIVLSASQENNNDSVAATELNTFVYEATGVKFPIIYDNEIVSAEDGKYISIGHTTLSKAAKIVVDDEALFRSGFITKTIDDDLYLLGGEDIYSKGSVYAVYDYLHEILGYEYYAPKCYALNYVLSVPFTQINKTEVPDIPTRALSHYTLRNDAEYALRMRLEENVAQTSWILSGHSMSDIASSNSYASSNPDWFTADLKGYCFSNDSLREHLVGRIKDRIVGNIDSKAYLVQVGQADTVSFCSCSTCTTEIAEKYGTYGGQLIGLINEISDEIMPWLKANYPEKEILFTTFAYHYSENPPCVKNDETGEWEPFSQYVIPRENVGVYWAPINMDYSKPIYDESSAINATSMAALEGWKALTDNIFVWSYCTNFKHYYINIDNFGSIAENYRTYAKFGVQYVFDEGPDRSGTPTFEELRIYIQSKLLWDVSLDINELIEDFMAHYYGVASDDVLKYFNWLNAYYDYLQSKSLMTGTIYFTIDGSNIWTMGILNDISARLDEAIAKVEKANLSQSDKTEYTNRLNRLYCTVWYLYFKHYEGYFTESQLEVMREKYEKTCALYAMIKEKE